MFLALLLLFTVVPAAEIGLFVVVGGEIGPWATVAVVLFTGLAGASLARMQGILVLQQVQQALARGTIPADELTEGAIVLFGGALLLTPGFLTDVWGLCCLLPPTRRLFALGLKRWFGRRVQRTGRGRVEMGGWHMWTGNVRPGPAAHEPRVRIDASEPPEEPTGTRSGRTTIDATFSVVSEPSKRKDSKQGGDRPPDPSDDSGDPG